MPEDRALRLLLQVEEVHLLGDPPVVALRRLLEPGQVGVEVGLRAEGDAVDALQHRTTRVAAPVGAGDRGQPEAVGRHLPGVGEVRAAAEVLPGAVPVHADRVGGRDRLDQLDLVGLVRRLVVADGAVAVPDLPAHRVAGGDDLAHPRFDGREVVGGEGLRAVEVVVPAVLDHRADRDLHLRPELLHGAGHDVGAVVADQLERRVVPGGDDRDASVRVERQRQVGEAAVDDRRERGFAERLRDRASDVGGGGTGREAAHGAVGERDGDLLQRGCKLAHVALLVASAPTARPVPRMLPNTRRSAAVKGGYAPWRREPARAAPVPPAAVFAARGRRVARGGAGG